MVNLYPIGDWPIEIEKRTNQRNYGRANFFLQELFLLKQYYENTFSGFKDAIEERIFDISDDVSEPFLKVNFRKALNEELKSFENVGFCYRKIYNNLKNLGVNLTGLPKELNYSERLN